MASFKFKEIIETFEACGIPYSQWAETKIDINVTINGTAVGHIDMPEYRLDRDIRFDVDEKAEQCDVDFDIDGANHLVMDVTAIF